MVIHFRFAGVKIEEKAFPGHPLGLGGDLPADPADQSPPAIDWSKTMTARSILEHEGLQGSAPYLVFKSDGTVQFGRRSGPGDKLSVGF